MTTNTPRIFGQLKPTDTANMTRLYQVPVNTRAQVTMFVCNQDDVAEYFRIALVPNPGDVLNLTTARYIAYDAILAPNGVFSVSGIGLNQGDAIWVKSTYGQLSFTATGIQLT